MTADRRSPADATDRPERANAWSGPAPRMRDLRHTHGNHDPRAWHWFARGPVVAADGGRRDDRTRRRRDIEDEQLRDVSHRPPHGPDANRVWERGEEPDDPAAADRDDEAEAEGPR